MKNINWKKILPHIIAVALFAIIAIIYCKPSFEGKVLQQNDISQWKAMAQSSFKFKEANGHFPLWTNSMFCGMPGYQIAMDGEIKYSFVSLGYVEKVLTLGLPRPASFFFLACLCFYILALILRCNPYVAIGAAISYGYCTYNPVIIVAGHETKMMAIAYLPALIGSLILLFNKKYILGTALTALFTTFLIGANHLQITYYSAIIIVFMVVGFLIDCINSKNFKHLFIVGGLALGAALLGVGVNTISLLTTSEYGKLSIRGGSVLADENGKGNATKSGLNKDYAFSYSLYKTEPLAMMIPRIYGGSSGLEINEEDSKAIAKLREMQPQLAQQLQGYVGSYWGGIGGTSGPPYIGAIVCFLALIGFVILDDKYKWWILATIIFSFMLSWGKYFEGFNTWMLNNLPAYNKFRAPSMILVVPTFLLSMMSALTLQKIISTVDKVALWEKYKKGLYVASGMMLLALMVYFTADFAGDADKALLKQASEMKDAQQNAAMFDTIKSFVNAIREDRKGLFMSDFIRTLALMGFAGGVIWLYIKNKISDLVTIGLISIVAFIDVMNINLKYFNNDKFADAAEYADSNYKESAVDTELLKDKSFYRVFNVRQGLQGAFNGDAITSYHHNSIGGYHPAKLSIYQDIIEKQLYNFPNCMPVVNMLNAKYIIQQDEKTGQSLAIPNPNALGNCWFVNGVIFKSSPKEVMNTLTTLNTKDSAIVEVADKALVKYDAEDDSTAKISLVKNDNDFVEYTSTCKAAKFAVFRDRKSTRLNSSHLDLSRMPSSA